MRLDEDYLRELELWPMFALKRATAKDLPRDDSGDRADRTDRTDRTEGGTRNIEKSQNSETLKTSAAPAFVPTQNPNPISNPNPSTKPRSNVPKSAPVAELQPIDPERGARIAALDWAGLEAEAANCRACGLCKQRKQAVLGVGAKDAPWFFVGEGPGAEEDQQGEPFVGQSGQLLDAMLAASGLQRGREVYIANVVKCRPPANRTPSAEEAAACAPFLDRQIELVGPKLIVALGKTAVIRLTQSEASMASLRGQQHSYTLHGNVIPMVATYHPSYLLRNPPDKLKAWEDLMFAKKTIIYSAP